MKKIASVRKKVILKLILNIYPFEGELLMLTRKLAQEKE